MMTIKDIEDICEKHDFNTDYDENTWQDKAGLTISQYTPAGEDWSEILEASSVGDFVGNLEKRIENWDIDEEVEPYIDMRGRNGIPSSIRELLEDAEWKLNTLKELLADIKTAMANDMDVMRGKDESKELKEDAVNGPYYDLMIKYTDGSNSYPRMSADGAGKMLSAEIDRIATVKVNHNKAESRELKTEEKTIVPVSELPDMCYGVLPSDCSIIIIKKGEKGYYTTNKNYESAYADIKDYEERCKKADELCNKLNSQIDVTPEQRQSMEIRSMFGNWEDKKEENNTFGKTTANDAEYYNYVKGLLDSGAIDDPKYYNKLSDAEKDDLIRNTWMKDDEIKKCFTSLKEEAVTPDKEYMGVKYFNNVDGRCPICDSALYYDAVEHVDGDMEYYPWVCEKCGQRGEAWFKEIFQGHTVITPDTDDNIDLPFNDSKSIKAEN